jgi:hypothetical protein
MFAITSTRIVGLIAVVCAVVVAPQALAAPSATSRIAPPDAAGVDLSGFDLKAGFDPKAASRIAPPDAAGVDLSGFDLKAGFESKAASRIAPSDAVQGYDLSGFDLTVFNNLPGYREQQEYLAAVAAAASYKSFKAVTKAIALKAANAAAIDALQRRSVALDAAYRKLYPGAYRQAAQASDTAAVWSFPAFCNDQAMVDYDYIVYSRCQA